MSQFKELDIGKLSIELVMFTLYNIDTVQFILRSYRNLHHIVMFCDIKVRSQVTIPSIQAQARICNCGMVMLYCLICKPVLTSTILTCMCFYSHSPEIYIRFNSIYVHCMNRYTCMRLKWKKRGGVISFLLLFGCVGTCLFLPLFLMKWKGIKNL